MVEKDLVLYNTELNPLNNYLSNFLGSVQNCYIAFFIFLSTSRRFKTHVVIELRSILLAYFQPYNLP